MAYDSERDEFSWGYSPKADGTGYKPGVQSPKLSDALRVLRRHVKNPAKTRLQMVVVGKVYKGKHKQDFKGITGNVTFGSLEATASSAGLTGKAVTHGGGGFSTEQKVAQLLGLNEVPEKITGIYFRILD